ncbi:hypothetical protein WDW37_03585 [Bdellovibrionota bacterium FG-1]
MIRLTTDLGWICCLLIFISHSANAQCHLTEDEHSRIRFKLEVLFNESELLLRNHRADLSDIRHQEREFKTLRVFERIPFEDDAHDTHDTHDTRHIQDLKAELAQSAQARGLRLIALKPEVKRTARFSKTPAWLYSDQLSEFRLSNSQIADETHFHLVVTGGKSKVLQWIQHWPEELLRLTQLVDSPNSIRSLGPSRFQISAKTFHFRKTSFPKLILRPPLELLPPSSRHSPDCLAQKAPVLWTLIDRIQDLRPKTKDLYSTREQLMLNSARMSFFTAQAIGHNKRLPIAE